jgi:hypothetical protein
LSKKRLRTVLVLFLEAFGEPCRYCGFTPSVGVCGRCFDRFLTGWPLRKEESAPPFAGLGGVDASPLGGPADTALLRARKRGRGPWEAN